MEIVKKIIKIIFLLSVMVTAVGFWQREKLPASDLILPQLSGDPKQTETEAVDFSIEKDGYRAEIKPIFDYELFGLVVEDYDSDVWHDIMHENDPFNTNDICVIWGRNVKDNLYDSFKFTHGEFTCFYQTSDRVAYRNFSEDQLSNNHLIPSDESLGKKIKNSKPGDQIHLAGQLVNYRIVGPGSGAGSRNTSTSREDRGNGACEVIYVTEFDNLMVGNEIFALGYKYGRLAALGCLGILIILFFIEVVFGISRKDRGV